ncbi:MAG: hypothetical protein NUV74_16580 [Candidatus Brocadiaceae bacterium]|nr:hypothetical protein [Candidatus Brocadiaceae bacterium]
MDRINLYRLTELEKDISLHIAKEENLAQYAKGNPSESTERSSFSSEK